MDAGKKKVPDKGHGPMTQGATGNKDYDPTTQRDRPSSQEITMFLPYSSLRNTEGRESLQQAESAMTDDGQSRSGLSRVFLRMFSGGQSAKPVASTPHTKPADQMTTAHTSKSKAPTPSTRSHPDNSSTKGPISSTQQTKMLVRPARGGNTNTQNRAPLASGNMASHPQSSLSTKSAALNRAPPSRQPLPSGVAKWSSSAEEVILADNDQLSLTSYAQPRAVGVSGLERQSASVGKGRSGVEKSSQVNRSEVLSRFGMIRKDEEGSDLRKYWMPDKACKECSDCGVKFSLFTRRHHCRICGRIFCHTCCSLTIPAHELRANMLGNLRVCKECSNIFKDFKLRKPKQDSPLLSSEGQSSDSYSLSSRVPGPMMSAKGQVTSGDPQPSMSSSAGEGTLSGTFKHSVMVSHPVSMLSPRLSLDDASGRSQELSDLSPSRHDIYRLTHRGGQTGLTGFDSLTVGRDSLLDLDEDELEDIATDVWLKLQAPDSGLPRLNHRSRLLRNFPDTYSGHELVEWLVVNEHIRSREVAIRVGQALVDTKRLRIVNSDKGHFFRDDGYLFLELGEADKLVQQSSETGVLTDAPKWFLRLRDDEELETKGEQNITHVSHTNSLPLVERHGLTLSSVSLSAEKRKSRPESYTSLGRGELENEDEYLVIEQEQSMPETHNSSYFPSTPSIDTTVTNLTKQNFSVVRNEEVVKSLSVDGLSVATEAAKECADEKSKMSISRDDALSRYEHVHRRHFNNLMIQQMKTLGLSLQWLDIIRPLIMEAAQNVRTDVFPGDSMDMSQYIQIKKIPRGLKSNSTLVYGVVCSKNVTHKKMIRSINSPKILLLNCAFEFQRKENQLSSFDTLHLQEEEYLKNLVVKVSTIKPNLILVQKSVSRLALEMLYELGIVVAVNVKPSVMNRVARCTKGEILHSLDQLMFVTTSIFGTCGHFYIRNFLLSDGVKKTLMYFDGCPRELGCVITLQGARIRELKKVKKMVLLGLRIAHNSILESQFLVDEFAWPNEDSEQDLSTPVDDYTSFCSTPEWPIYPSLGYPLDSVSQTELQKKLEALKYVVKLKDDEDDKQQATETAPTQESDISAPQEKQVEDLVTKNNLTIDGELDRQSTENILTPATENLEEGELVTNQDTGTQPTVIAAEMIIQESLPTIESTAEASKELLVQPQTPPPHSGAITSEKFDMLAEEEFKLAYQSQLLSISPYVKFKVPYLQTWKGRSADSRKYLPSVIYWSHQFKPKNLFKHAQRLELNPTTCMEMGLTKNTVQNLVGMESGCGNENLNIEVVPSEPHYKSISSHPFTSSLFLIQASSNEMRAALADFRSRAGYQDEDNNFLFKAAERASNYHLHLQKMFTKYREFELAAAAVEESPALSEREVFMATSEMGSKKKSKGNREGGRKTKDPFKRFMVGNQGSKVQPEVNKAGNDSANSVVVSLNLSTPDNQQQEVPKDSSLVLDDSDTVLPSMELVSTDNNLEDLGTPNTLSSSDEDDYLEEHTAKSVTGKGRDSGGMRISEKFGTLEDFDSSPQNNSNKDDDHHGDLNYETWLAADEQVDCFDPAKHQGLMILFSNTAHDGQKHQLPCVIPCQIPMFYYGHNDISLGEFLHRYAFKPFYRCNSCGGDMVQHQRHVIHAQSAIHISMQQLVSPLPGNDEGIYTWLACRYCTDQCTPYTKMSRESLLFSFAKFLELKFYSETYITRYQGDDTSTCSHSLHKDYVQYFLHKDKIAAFQPGTVELLDVLIPPRSIHITTPRRKYHLDFKTEVKCAQRIVEGVFYRIGERLEKYRLDPVANTIDDHITESKVMRDALRSKVKQIKDLIVQGAPLLLGKDELKGSMKFDCDTEASIISDLQDKLTDLKRCVVDLVDCWNIKLEYLDSKIKEHRHRMRERDNAQGEISRDNLGVAPPTSSAHTTASQPSITTMERNSPALDDMPVGSSHSGSVDLSAISSITTVGGRDFLLRATNTHSRNLSDSGLLQSLEGKSHKRQLSDSISSHLHASTSGSIGGLSNGDTLTTPSGGQSLSELTEEGNGGIPHGGSEEAQNKMYFELGGVPDGREGESPNGGKLLAETSEAEEESSDSKNNTDVISTGATEASSNLKREVPMVTEKEEADAQTDSAGGILARLRGKEPQEAKDDPTRFYLLDPYIIKTNSSANSHGSTQSHSNSTSPYPEPVVKSGKKQGNHQKRNRLAQIATESHSEARSGEKRSFKEKILTRPFQRLPPPFPSSEHHSMQSVVTVPVSIYEKEPTSIIAFALSSRVYLYKLKLLQERGAGKVGGASTKAAEVTAATISSPKLRRHVADTEKPVHPGSNVTTLRTYFKAVGNELKKKSSAISLFSGSASIQTFPEVVDTSTPESSSSRSDFTASMSGGRSYDPNMPAGSRLSGQTNEAGISGVGGAEEVDSGKVTPHISLEFTSPDKSASFFCKIYYAEQFRELRELIFPSGEESFIRSLSRCIKYDAKGGKSRSAFCKVADDRFIMKQVKSIEISSFEHFAPQYLQYVTKALNEKRPLTLAKILGAYSVGFRNSRSGTSKRLDVLVMENLLYKHTTNKVFDLKGSMRSRYIDPSKESSGDVLLDENYLNFICSNPVYVHPHSKRVLMQAIMADSEFLARNAIMDYSLLTCIDESIGELVVGIIDYIRTFTLDKKVEMYLKKTAGKTLPTVVYPELYRKRFCEAMDRYFTVVPDKWTGLMANVKY